jgi:hypothetical protein
VHRSHSPPPKKKYPLARSTQMTAQPQRKVPSRVRPSVRPSARPRGVGRGREAETQTQTDRETERQRERERERETGPPELRAERIQEDPIIERSRPVYRPCRQSLQLGPSNVVCPGLWDFSHSRESKLCLLQSLTWFKVSIFPVPIHQSGGAG